MHRTSALARFAIGAVSVIGVAALAGWSPQQKGTFIRFAHVPHIANDGRVAFGYHDDIWVTEADGSRARRITAHLANDYTPRFSPDGQWIAFTSNRTGNPDVFLVPAAGGEPKQLTWHSGNDEALQWTADGEALIIWSNRGPGAYGSPLYRLAIEGEPALPLAIPSGRLGALNADGSLLAYNRGLPSTGIWRKDFKGNSAVGINLLDVKSGEITELTNTDAKQYQTFVNDLYPMWGADGMLYFTSERAGTYNIFRMPARGGAPQQVTRFTAGGVFYPSISNDGKKMVFQNDFDLWTLDLPGGSPKKLTIPVAFDPKDGDIAVLTGDNRPDGFAPAPSGERVAVDFHGDIRIVPIELGVGEPTTVATSAWRESGQMFSPDGQKLAYISDESGEQEIWIYDLASATRKKLTTQQSEKGDITWSPNSQKLAYTGDNKIWEIDFMTTGSQQPQPREIAANVAGGFNIGEYTADGSWMTYSRRDDENNADVYLYDVKAKKEHNVTQSPNTETLGALTSDGRYVVFTSNRDAATNQLFVVSLTPRTEDPNDPLVRQRMEREAGGGRGRAAGLAATMNPEAIDLAGIEERAFQLTSGANAVGGFFVGADGRTIYFSVGGGGGGRGGRGPAPATPAPGRGRAGAPAAAGGDEGTGFFAIDIDGRNRRRIAAGNYPGMMVTADKRAIFFRAPAAAGAAAAPAGRGGAAAGGGQELRRLVIATPNREDPVTFQFRVVVDQRQEWKQMFNEMWRIMKYRYYNPSMNGYDWAALRAKYEPILEFAGTNEDVYDLGNALIGEMSSSHTGMSGPASRTPTREYGTRFLGFEMEPADGKHRITHIYRTGPADKEWLKLKVGDYVLAVDGQELKAGDNYWKLLSETINDYIPVRVASSAAGTGARTVRIASVTTLQNIKYEGFVRNNRDIVEKATNNQIAYVHIRAMDQPSLERFQTEIDRYWQRKGIIIDVRYNTGGNIDEELLDIIERRPYMYTNGRTGARTWGRRPRQAIAGPKVMMINARSFSDGEATPMGFRTLGLGRIVGTPTAGGVIWTGSWSLINGGTVRTPSQYAVVYDPTKPNNYGINLENYGVPPDVWVENSPSDDMRGNDRELAAAIEEVMRMLRASPGQFPGVGPVQAGPPPAGRGGR